jgi:hypothetical protein
MRRIVKILGKCTATIVAVVLLAIVGTSVTAIYDFAPIKPFAGNDIFNPYRNLDTSKRWQRASFHNHCRVEGILNECEYSADTVRERLERFGTNIVTISNHNEISEGDAPLYEHGYNLLKFHKLVFGAERVIRFDHLLPIFLSQRQMQMDLLLATGDIVQFNHPLRTPLTTLRQMQYLEGYRLMELDSGRSTENGYWDEALSSGHYSFGVANDDLHDPDNTRKIARRCNFIQTKSSDYKDIIEALNSGCYYSMRLPDYGDGDWAIKVERNKSLPAIKNIGVEGTTLFIRLSEAADSIVITSDRGRRQIVAIDADTARYDLRAEDSYARFTAYFPEGEVIYTNPFARYDATTEDSPFREPSHRANIALTILFNLLLAVVAYAIIHLTILLWKR